MQLTTTAELRLSPGLSAQEMLKILKQTIVQQGRSNRVLCFYLHDMKRRREYQSFGCSSTVQFAETHLELGRSRTCDLIATGKALLELVKIDAAPACLVGSARECRTRGVTSGHESD